MELGLYYINGRWYDPEIMQYLNADSPENIIALANVLNSLDRNAITVANIISFDINSDTIFTSGEYSPDPYDENADKTWWQLHWKKVVQWVAFAIAVLATIIVTIINPAAGASMALYCLKASISGIIIGGVVGAITSIAQGKNIWEGILTGAWYGFMNAYTTAAVMYGISAAANAMSSTVNKAKPCDGACFIAGTLVLCKDQDGNECHKPIEEIEVGDYVWAYNEETGESDWKPVLRLFRNETKEWYHVFAAGEEIVCTPNHPFYVVDKGFVEAKDLKIFDILLQSDGTHAIIKDIDVEKLEKAETTYNFEVADFHTYYVTESSILVHNKCPAGSPLPNEGLPNSTALRYDVEGNLYTAKTYGADGRVVARIDFQGKPHYAVDVGKSIIPHVHPIVYDLEIYYRELNAVSLQYYIGSLL
ncbi:MAG: hypothetical protein J1F36_01580 [Clostridiales bacterium]|nr:hypothetical protein [Clostridiales bacterium]